MISVCVVPHDLLQSEMFAVLQPLTFEDVCKGTFANSAYQLVELRYVLFTHLDLFLDKAVDFMLRPQAVQQLNLPKDAIQHIHWVGLLLPVTELTFNIFSDAHIKTGGAPPHLRLGFVRVENNIKALRGPLMDEPKFVITKAFDTVVVL